MHFLRLFVTAGKRWLQADASRSAAAVAYFTPFALVPLILISVNIVGWITDETLFAALLRSWGEMLGVGATEMVAGAVEQFEPTNAYYGIPILAVLFLGAMVVFTFNNLSVGLRKVWDVPGRGVRGGIETALRSVTFFILLQAFFVAVFIIEIVIPAALVIDGVMPLQRLLLFLATIVLFTLGYQILTWQSPSFPARVSGALVVAITFIFLRTIVDWWLRFTPAIEQYGGAGIVFGLLVWIYVTTMVIFYGAAYAWAFDHESVGRKRRLRRRV